MNVDLVCGDITTLAADAIVCPAHKHLIRGQGLSAQLFDLLGDELKQACDQLGPCAVGEAACTSAFDLPATYIIHTVTPQWSSGDQWSYSELRQLKRCYQSVAQLAVDRGVKSLVFPALGAGSNRFPQAIAAHEAFEALAPWTDLFDSLVVCLHCPEDCDVWRQTQDAFESNSGQGHILH